jgi:NAD(P)-dependent dehydrogenase (short-subunit alcohol dehydrogenase family)
MQISGSVCVVTGASSGIGAAGARLLADQGARVVLAARRADRLERLAGELPDALAVPTDVTAPGALEHLVQRTLDTYGRLDVLVNDAGQGLHVPILELDPQDLRAVYELNVVAPLRAMQLVMPAMRAQGGGAIVNVSSATSLRVFAGLGGYSSTKAALNMLSQVARLEFAEAGVVVSVVYPSVTATEFHQRLRAGSFAGGGHQIPVDPPRARRSGDRARDPRGGRARAGRRPAARAHPGIRRRLVGALGPPGAWQRWGTAMILVTAGNGRTGRAVISALARHGHTVRAFDLAPEPAELVDLGASEVIAGDMLAPAELGRAIDGVRAVIHIGPPMDPQEADMGRAVVAAARTAGVRHFVQFSVTHPQLEPLLNHQAKLAVERTVLLSRLPFTILQPMHYMQNIDVARAVATGVVAQPYDPNTPLAHVDLEDVAEVAARVVGDPAHRYATYELCGDDFISGREIAAIIAAASGTPVVARQVPVTPPAASAAPTWREDYRADAMVRLFDHYGRYGITGNPNVLTWLLGRPPARVAAYVHRHRPAG